jgi:hypothetical protein
MSTTDDNVRLGAEALRRGDARAARESFSKALDAGRIDAAGLLGLAYACRMLKDTQGESVAVERLLALDPRNVRGLILKGDRLAAEGQMRSAASFYLAALRNAPPPQQLTPDLAAELERARRACETYSRQFQSYLSEQLGSRGFDPETSSRRFAESVDILTGRKRIYLQQPKYYYFPGLPQIQFYEREQFPWLDQVEAATDEIRAELLELMRDPNAFAPYVQGDPNRPRKDQAGMLNNPEWSAFYIWKNGKLITENAERCPRTLAALKDVPLASVTNRSPSVLFSLLKPRARIPPHNGFVNTRLICHLPLLVPGRAMFRVGNEVRQWQEGRAWVFDDTIEHEAWNEADQTRVILLFEVWRPELSEEERRLVTALFETIDALEGGAREWTI